MAYNIANLVTLGQYKALATRVNTELTKSNAQIDLAIKKVSVSGNLVEFFRSTDAGATAAFSVDFPKEWVLDQAKTTFVDKFKFSPADYPGAIDPNLDDNPVFVLAVKGTSTTSGVADEETTTYSFLNMKTLVDTYSPETGETAITINGYKVSIKVPNTITGKAGVENALKKTANGLEVDISGKADKVTGATNGNVAGLDANGNLTDTGIVANNVAQKATGTTQDNVSVVNSDGTYKDGGVAITSVARRSTGVTANNVALLNANGDAIDSNVAIATDAEATEVLTEIFGAQEP